MVHSVLDESPMASSLRAKLVRKKKHRPRRPVVAEKLKDQVPMDGTKQLGIGAKKILVATERNARDLIFQRNQELARASMARDIAFEERRKALSEKKREVHDDGTDA